MTDQVVAPVMPKHRLQEMDSDLFRVVCLTDGTISHVEIMCRDSVRDPWHQIGMGVARRRRGDRRNPDIGMNLALARALRNAADRTETRARQLGYDVDGGPRV